MYKYSTFYWFLIALLFIGCNTSEKQKNASDKSNTKTNTLKSNSFLINGTSFSPNKSYVYLFETRDDSFNVLDSTLVNNTNFSFNGSVESPKMYYISESRDLKKGYSFLVDNSEIFVFLSPRDGFSTSYSNSEIQKEYNEYTNKTSEFKDRGMGLYYGLKGDFSSRNIKKLKQERTKLFSENNDYTASFIKAHPESYYSTMLIKNHLKTYNSKTLRSLYNGLSKTIKDNAYSKNLDSLIAVKESEVKKRLPVVAGTKTKTATKPKIKEEYRPKAYKISGRNPYGQNMSLNSIPKGKVILVDFWASWCAPCRATNPNLIILYNKYHSKGLEIMSISEDKGEAEWLNAIKADGLTWDYHVIDKNKSIAFRYGVQSIPFKLLIDKKGRIASQKISGGALERRIQELLNE